jgi:hypothetical protein
MMTFVHAMLWPALSSTHSLISGGLKPTCWGGPRTTGLSRHCLISDRQRGWRTEEKVVTSARPARRLKRPAPFPVPKSRFSDCRHPDVRTVGPRRRKLVGRPRAAPIRRAAFCPPSRFRTLPGRVRKSSSLGVIRRRLKIKRRIARARNAVGVLQRTKSRISEDKGLAQSKTEAADLGHWRILGKAFHRIGKGVRQRRP